MTTKPEDFSAVLQINANNMHLWIEFWQKGDTQMVGDITRSMDGPNLQEHLFGAIVYQWASDHIADLRQRLEAI